MAIILCNTAILQQYEDSITALANRVKIRADEVAQLCLLESDNKGTSVFRGMTAKVTGVFSQGTSIESNCVRKQKLPQFETLDDLSEDEFACVEKYHTDSNLFNSPNKSRALD